MVRPKLLDLFCCQGGASMGYSRAGFDVTGVDINPQRRYPFAFVQADAIEYVKAHGHEYDAIHASPPCQRYTTAQRLRGNDHPDLVAPTRDALMATGKPWVIENVEGSPLIDPVLFCGAMFPGLAVYRHRLIESSHPIDQLDHPDHVAPLRKMGRPPQPGEFMHVVGNYSGAREAQRAMGIDWMSRDGMREAIPPAYAQFIGDQLMEAL